MSKVVLVTGSGRGLGRAYAQRLAAGGATVAVADVDETAARQTAQDICADGGVAEGAWVDVGDPAAVTEMVDDVLARWGAIDALVNNAGANITVGRSIEAVSFSEWQATVAVNLTGTWLCTQAVLPAMRRRASGTIVNVSSTLVTQGTPPPSAPYVAAKGGVVALTRAVAKEVGRDGITVNAIAPGLVPMDKAADPAKARILAPLLEAVVAQQSIPRVGEPDDLAGVVEFLVSDAARFITGQVLNVDGGWALV